MVSLLPHIFRRCALAVLCAALLSGCVKGLFGGDTNILRPEIIKVQGHTDEPKPPAKICPEPEATSAPAGQQPATQEKTGKPSPPVEQKLLPQKLSPQSPEQLMPVPPPPSSKPSESPQSIAPVAARPLAAMAATVVTCGDVVMTEDTTWQGEVLVSGAVTVASQATLTIAAGSVVRFAGGGGLLIEGRVVANGTPAKPVLLTSRFADPAKGDWEGIALLGSEKKNFLGNCRIEGAESGLDATFSTVTLRDVSFARCTTGARLHDTVVTMNGGGATGCDTGMAIVGGEAKLGNTAITGNRVGVVAQRSSLHVAGGIVTGNAAAGVEASDTRLNISGGKFAANGTGLNLTSCQGSVSGCSIAKNVDYGLVLANSRVKVRDNEIAGNGRAGLKVEDGSGAAWGNAFNANGSWDLFNAGTEDFRAMGNWWGGIPTAEIGKRVYDRRVNSSRGRVLYLPVASRPDSAVRSRPAE